MRPSTLCFAVPSRLRIASPCQGIRVSFPAFSGISAMLQHAKAPSRKDFIGHRQTRDLRYATPSHAGVYMFDRPDRTYDVIAARILQKMPRLLRSASSDWLYPGSMLKSCLCGFNWNNSSLDIRPYFTLHHSQIIFSLQIQPKLSLNPKIAL